MSDMETPHLSVIIPAYNEQERLPRTLRDVTAYLSAQPFRSEVLIVDDGSRDATAEIVASWPAGQVPTRLIQHPDRANHGKGAAVTRGMLAAAGDFRLFMDADNSTTIDQVGQFWPFFSRGYDLLIGSRKIAGARVSVHQAKYKEWAGSLGNLFVRLLAVPGILDTQAGFKMFTRRSVEVVFPRLTIKRWGYDIEILVIARRHGLRFCELPITWVNASGSKVSLSTYFEVLYEVWRIRRNLLAGKYS
jgi:dolichyl-phosphate beta-glucosyltransferase